MKPYTYLLIDFFTVIVCFIASFDRRIRFDKQFGAFFLSAAIVAIPFISWDIWFTKTGVWWFNTDYATGIMLAGMPIEEWLFFFCIPFACVFTYYCLDKFFDLRWTSAFNNVIVFLGFIVCVVLMLLYYNRAYTFVTAMFTLVVLLFLHFMGKKEWIGQATFVYLILMLGFFPVNGILTGTGLESPVVNYNPSQFIGVRMFTIPVEDAMYGYSQFLLNIYFFKLLQQRKSMVAYSKAINKAEL
jgi:lycopene cyclase domain-containing protein